MSKRLIMVIIIFMSGFANCVNAEVSHPFSKNQPMLYEKEGNIFAAFFNGDDFQYEYMLTGDGLNSNPVSSPDGSKIVFVREVIEPYDLSEELYVRDDNYQYDRIIDELWIMNSDGSGQDILVRYITPNKVDPVNISQKKIRCIFKDSIRFSADGKKVYFINWEWETSGGLRCVNIDGTDEHFITDANYLEVIDKGRYKNNLLISQHRYFLLGGSYDWYYVFTPEGKEVGPLAEDLDGIDWDFLYFEQEKE